MTEKEIPRRKRTLLLAEAHSEQMLARIRFTFASVCAGFSLYLFGMNKITFTICAVQLAMLIFVCLYNGTFLFESKKYPLPRYVAFISSFLDVSVVTGFIWTFHQANLSEQWIHGIFFPVYFIVVGFTALHNQEMLSVFTGVLSGAMYFALQSLILAPARGISFVQEPQYTAGVLLLLVASLVSAMISRNNVQSINKIAVTEGRVSTMGTMLPMMLFRVDKRGKILWTKAMSGSKFNLSSDQLIDRNIRELFEDTNSFRVGTGPVQGTYKTKQFTDDTMYVDVLIKPEEGKNGVFQGTLIDVTDRQLAIAQREEMEQRLFQYKKMESLGTLASGMAHDFNNILQTVTDIIGRVMRETKEENTKLQMNLVTQTLSDAHFLVSELLALGRKKPLNYSPVNVSRLLREIAPWFGSQIGESYEIVLNLPDDDLWIHADVNYLKRIFQNLFGNARDAMPQGGIISIEAFLMRTESEDRTVVIRFSDTGVGIPENIAEKIFDPFFTTKKKGKGTGLGLALVRRIVSLHKGIVLLEKTGHQGTTFRIEIPECSQTGYEVDTKAILVRRVTTTILVLDDDPKMCSILTFFLTELSYKAFQASTMEDGLRILRENIEECRVLIMDWKIGDSNPHEIITRFRDLKPDLIVIVVSGYQPHQKSMKAMNIARWLTKPYDKNRLDLEIQKTLYMADHPRK
jgi:signal transduction histidine kinase/ActR/RegA family two-component response regulator